MGALLCLRSTDENGEREPRTGNWKPETGNPKLETPLVANPTVGCLKTDSPRGTPGADQSRRFAEKLAVPPKIKRLRNASVAVGDLVRGVQ